MWVLEASRGKGTVKEAKSLKRGSFQYGERTMFDPETGVEFPNFWIAVTTIEEAEEAIKGFPHFQWEIVR
jgi:hypothetical protein